MTKDNGMNETLISTGGRKNQYWEVYSIPWGFRLYCFDHATLAYTQRFSRLMTAEMAGDDWVRTRKWNKEHVA